MMLELSTAEKFEQLHSLLAMIQADAMESSTTRHCGLMLDVAIQKLAELQAQVTPS